MPAIVPQTHTKSFHPGLNDPTSKPEIGSEIRQSVCASAPLSQGDRVLHEHWGLGRVIHVGTCTTDEVTICFDDGQRTASTRSLRRLLPRTVVAQLIERSTPNISAWMVRKADEQGAIEPDVRGRFAGHVVHYYDAARISCLIEQISRQDAWSIGAMVFHPEYGPGRVVAWQSRMSSRIEDGIRLVQFFGDSSPVVVSVQQLRHLLSSQVIANRLRLNRKTFAKLAKRKGVCPDYVTSDSRVREFYDEGRIEDIRKRWSAFERSDSFPPGCLILDRQGEIARVEFRDVRGQLHLRYLDSLGPIQPADTANVRKLVSLRELARSEQMSRYKLNRLLTAVGIQPVHQDGRAIYFDGNKAREAVRDRLGREGSAVSLAMLASRTGISEAVLARKVRQGCIGTTGQATHAVDASEAERIEELVRVLQSRRESLKSLGICQLQPRGRTGQEVAAWDIAQLIEVAQPLTRLQRIGLFGQVAWLCDGAGRYRFREALECYILSSFKLSSFKTTGDDRQQVQGAHVLLALLGHLPTEFACYRSRLAFIASGAPQVYGTMDELQSLARDAGLHSRTSYERFQAQISASVADLLTRERIELGLGTSEPLSMRNGCLYPEDDFVRGAVIVCVNDQKPEVGLIVRVEQQAWNAVVRGWDKTVVVRFTHEERRMNPYTRTTNAQQSKGVVVLLRAGEVIAVLHKIRERLQAEQMPGQLLHGSMERKAS